MTAFKHWIVLVVLLSTSGGCRGDRCRDRPPEAQITIELSGVVAARTDVVLIVNGAAPLTRTFSRPNPRFVIEFGTLDMPPRSLVIKATAYDEAGKLVGVGDISTSFSQDGCNFIVVVVRPTIGPDASADALPRDAATREAQAADRALNDRAKVDAPKSDVAIPDISSLGDKPPSQDKTPLDQPAPSAKWSPMASGTTVELEKIWGTAENDVFAVGCGGTILHYDGTSWTKQTSGVSPCLVDIWGSAHNNIYAVGAGTTLLRFDGTSWSPASFGGGDALQSVHGTGPGDVWLGAVTGSVAHYSGTAWSFGKAGTTLGVTGIWSASPSSVWAVGYDGFIAHYSSGSWTTQTSSATGVMRDVWGTSDSNVYAGGYAGLWRFDGNWTQVTLPVAGGALGVHGTSAANVYVVSGGGGITRYDGTKWNLETSGTSENLFAVWVASNGVAFAGGANGVILRRK